MRNSLAGAMKNMFCILWLLAAAASFMAPAKAQDLLVHLPLDGSVRNAGSGGAAEVVGPNPTTGQGHFGSAMKFDGRSVIAVPDDLSSAHHPRVTMTAWVKADASASNTATDAVVKDGRSGGSSVAQEDGAADGDGSVNTSTGWYFSATEAYLTTVSGRSG